MAMTPNTDDEWKDVPPILYHYCNAEALRGIVENKCLWMSSVSSMNDYMEHNWLIEAARQHLRPRLRRSVLDPVDPFYQRLAERLFEQPPATHFVVGFSSDGDVLSQWRAYADDGAGFAVGFDPRLFGPRRLVPKLDRDSDDPDIGLTRVYYQNDDDLSSIDRHVADCHDRASPPSPTERADKCYENILQFALATKNPAFKEEKEWRIVWLPPDDVPAVSRHANLCGPKFRVRRGRVIPYYELKCEVLPHDVMPIREIVLGPKNPNRDDVSAINLLLRANHHNLANIEVSSSRATYR
jgi:hypothetical protein